MSFPISATPILKDSDADNFIDEVKRNLKNPSKLKPVPKLIQIEKKLQRLGILKKSEKNS